MPIYAYKCTVCGHAEDVLQKISDPLLTVCPQCGQSTYAKQVTAAGFQLKGSGWYVTDFRGGDNKGTGDAGSSSGTSTTSAPETTSASESTPSPSATPAASPAPATTASTPSAG